MTIGEWLARREPAPPRALAERVLGLLAPYAGEDAARAADACLDAGEALLLELLRDGCASRQSALDLLAADALVTYAFEAAGADSSGLEERAHRAMVRISALANVGA